MFRIHTVWGHESLPARHHINGIEVTTTRLTGGRLDERIFQNRWATSIKFQEMEEEEDRKPRLFRRSKIVFKKIAKWYLADAQTGSEQEAENLHLSIVKNLADGMSARAAAKHLGMAVQELDSKYGSPPVLGHCNYTNKRELK